MVLDDSLLGIVSNLSLASIAEIWDAICAHEFCNDICVGLIVANRKGPTGPTRALRGQGNKLLPCPLSRFPWPPWREQDARDADRRPLGVRDVADGGEGRKYSQGSSGSSVFFRATILRSCDYGFDRVRNVSSFGKVSTAQQ